MCENTVSYYVPKGYDYKEVFGVCGQTGYDGQRLVCYDCSNDFWLKWDNAWARSAGRGEY